MSVVLKIKDHFKSVSGKFSLWPLNSQAGNCSIRRSLYRNDLTDLPVAMICRTRSLLKRLVVVTGGPLGGVRVLPHKPVGAKK